MQRVAGDRGLAEDGLGNGAHRRRWQAPCPSAIAAAALAPLSAGCAGPLSTLDPAGPSAAAIAQVWWWMAGVSLLVSVGVIAAWLWAMRSHAAPRTQELRWLVGGGLVLPTVAVVALLIFGSPSGRHQWPWPGEDPAVVVDVTARQFSWRISYPGHTVVLQDELRMPAGRPVHIRTGSEDVIHSFWVPRLGGKLDAIPGRTLTLRLQADEPGRYLGVCAEFCGVGHANMPLVVIAMTPADFDAWLANPESSP
jgi:cytochrome c oxidase subunit 2